MLISKAVRRGYDPMSAIRAATLNPVIHYKLLPALLQPGQEADFIIVDNLKDFNVKQTWIAGALVAENGLSLIPSVTEKPENYFVAGDISPEQLKLRFSGSKAKIIKAIDGEIVTACLSETPALRDGYVISDTSRDILKIVVVNRYKNAAPSVALINGFGLRFGAIASTVAHDSHNIIAIGADDQSLLRAINLLIKHKGGICAVDDAEELVLPLPYAGLMSGMDAKSVALLYAALDKKAHSMGSTLRAPFMTLAFMALLVIPELKISDKGLFDGRTFQFTNLQD